MSTSVAVRFLSRSFLSLHSLANLAPSMTGGAPFAPKLQNCLNTSSNERAITYYHRYYPSKDVVSDTPPSESYTCHVTRHLERPRPLHSNQTIWACLVSWPAGNNLRKIHIGYIKKNKNRLFSAGHETRACLASHSLTCGVWRARLNMGLNDCMCIAPPNTTPTCMYM